MRGEVDTSRLETFSDAVFAIAITLLIIGVGIKAEGGSLAYRLAEQWPSYLSYVVSFAIIGILWLSHHEIFRDIRAADHGLFLLNLLFLLGVCFIPFPTKVMGDELASPVFASNEERSSSRDFRLKNLRFLLMPSVAAAALVAVVTLAVFSSLHTQSPVATIQLTPVEENEEYWGVAELHPQPSGNQQVELKLNNLDDPGPNSYYEAWFTSGEKYISAGTFTTINPGQTDVWLTTPPEVRNYSTLLITEQPTTSDSAPSKKAVLRGEVL